MNFGINQIQNNIQQIRKQIFDNANNFPKNNYSNFYQTSSVSNQLGNGNNVIKYVIKNTNNIYQILIFPYGKPMITIESVAGDEIIWFIVNTPIFIFRNQMFGTNIEPKIEKDILTYQFPEYSIILEKDKIPSITYQGKKPISVNKVTIQKEHERLSSFY